MDIPSPSTSAYRPGRLPSNAGSPPLTSRDVIKSTSSAPVPIMGALVSKEGRIGSLESQSSPPSGTSLGSLDMGDASEQPSTDCLTRIKSLQHCASTITELVNEKVIHCTLT